MSENISSLEIPDALASSPYFFFQIYFIRVLLLDSRSQSPLIIVKLPCIILFAFVDLSSIPKKRKKRIVGGHRSFTIRGYIIFSKDAHKPSINGFVLSILTLYY